MVVSVLSLGCMSTLNPDLSLVARSSLQSPQSQRRPGPASSEGQPGVWSELVGVDHDSAEVFPGCGLHSQVLWSLQEKQMFAGHKLPSWHAHRPCPTPLNHDISTDLKGAS